MSFVEEVEELESAEDFLNYFELEYDPKIVHVNRLHILQRFHDYLDQAEAHMPIDELSKKQVYRQLLLRSYQDFIESNAQAEKVFKVFKMTEPGSVFVSLSDIKT
jgi:nitrogenase-stabilizing/protective protein